MKKSVITQLLSQLEQLVQTELESGVEFWLARDLQGVLGYSNWQNFRKVVESAVTACETSGHKASDHFTEVSKMIALGKGGQRKIEDVMLTRYACYLVAQNGDPAKDEIAFCQTYFALQTRRQELIELRLAEVERLQARKKLTESEKLLSAIIFEKLDDDRSFGVIRSKGDRALFGGNSTEDMKNRLGVPHNRPLADFLPTITIKAKDFANEITTFSIGRDNLDNEPAISHEHVKNNTDVRNLLGERNIVPENLPPSEDLKKVQRRLKSEEKKLPRKGGTP
jgi:DNA-damage-inducible protein D